MPSKNRTCFVSYSHDSVDRDTLDYILHVINEHLGEKTEILYDQHLSYGGDINAFMRLLDNVDVVLILLTPSYKRKVELREGGVYDEFKRIWERYSEDADSSSSEQKTSSFELIPILFSGRMDEATPSEIRNLRQLDLTSLRVARKSTGEFQIPHAARSTALPALRALADQIRAVATVSSESFGRLSRSFYDRLFVDLKASFDDLTHLGYDYLDSILVKTSTYTRIESQVAFVVIGRKGSGKSTLTQVLPLIHPDRYQGIVSIIADEINLESLFSLYSDSQFRSDASAVVSRDEAFDFTWEAVLMLSVMDIILSTGTDSVTSLSSLQEQFISILRKYMMAFKGDQPSSGIEWRPGDFFNYAFNGTMSFVRDCIDGARSDHRLFLPDIGTRFTRERYFTSLFGDETLHAFRKLLTTFNKRFLITLDGFDTAFDRFRRESIRKGDQEQLTRRADFEVDWLRSLLTVATEARARRQDYFYTSLDFCVAAPKDRFIEVMRSERDSYRHWQRYCTLNWSGIELAILLRKRLEVLMQEKTKKVNPKERLEAILRHKEIRTLPMDLEFEYNGRAYKMPLFLYVLRHTFWRPREVLLYYASLLALADDMKRWQNSVKGDTVRKCIKVATRQVIESEFINEFHSTVLNISDVLSCFRRKKNILSHTELAEILATVRFVFAAGNIQDIGTIEKIKLLYEIGFLGVWAPRKELREQLGLDLDYAFYFNEGTSFFVGTDETEISTWSFVVHPIFSEYLRLDCQGHELTLQYSWEYLHLREASFRANQNL